MGDYRAVRESGPMADKKLRLLKEAALSSTTQLDAPVPGTASIKHPGMQPCGRCNRTLRAFKFGNWFCTNCNPHIAPRHLPWLNASPVRVKR